MPDDDLSPTCEPSREEQIRAATVGEPQVLDAPIVLSEYDPEWPRMFARESARIRAALGDRAVLLEHCGSTSVPGLAAKPIIDMLLTVPDSADEASYVPLLQAAGYVLRIREPDWWQHRCFKGPDVNVNLHVFSDGCPEVERMLLFRDTLRSDDEERLRYERAKRELASRPWKYVQNYADAKTSVVEAIVARARDRCAARTGAEGAEGGVAAPSRQGRDLPAPCARRQPREDQARETQTTKRR
jgi:GrpB-like predicted nucleotidyltransferase (UPF0157 family)